MKGLFKKLIGAFLGITMAAGIGASIYAGNKSEVIKTEAAASYDFTGDTITFANQGLENSVQYSDPFTNGTTSITFGGGSNDGKYYTTGSGMRTYGGGTITISSSSTISQLDFTWSGSYKPEADVATPTGYNTSTKSWTGSSSSVVLTRSSGSGHWRLQKIKITLGGTPTPTKTLESIAIEGNFGKTEFEIGESWAAAKTGLTVIGTYDDTTTDDITSQAHWSYNPASSIPGVTSLTVTATVGELTATHTEAVTVVSPEIPYASGTNYHMYFECDDIKYYFTGAMSGYYGAVSTNKEDAQVMLFETNSNGHNIYFIDSNSTKQYIGVSLNGTFTNFVFTTTVPESPWYYNGSTMVIIVNDAAYGIGSYKKNGNLYQSISASPSYYSNYFVNFELENDLTAEAFATIFLASITCDSTGATAPVFTKTWAELKTAYQALSGEEQDILEFANANENGTTIEQAMARYNYLVAKYGYENFIGRTIPSLSNRMNMVDNNQVIIMTVAIIVILSLTAAGTVIFVRKRKLNK